MRTILALAVGFWVGRQLYINYDKEEARRKEEEARQKLRAFLEKNGWTRGDADNQANEVLGV